MKFAYDIGFIIIICELILIDLMKAFYMKLRYASFIPYLFNSIDMYALFLLFSCLIASWIREPLFSHKTRSLIFVFTRKIRKNFKRKGFGFFRKKYIYSFFVFREKQFSWRFFFFNSYDFLVVLKLQKIASPFSHWLSWVRLAHLGTQTQINNNNNNNSNKHYW